ncbi:MAG: WG repeat-containing protein, partial [Paraclostridium sp.]
MVDKKLFLPILRNGKYGFIDENNNIKIKPKFKYVSERFRDGYCVVTYIKRINKSVRWVFGYLDEHGYNNIFLHLDSASDFSEGLSRIKINGKYGFLDKNLNEVINAK